MHLQKYVHQLQLICMHSYSCIHTKSHNSDVCTCILISITRKPIHTFVHESTNVDIQTYTYMYLCACTHESSHILSLYMHALPYCTRLVCLTGARLTSSTGERHPSLTLRYTSPAAQVMMGPLGGRASADRASLPIFPSA